MVRLNFFLIICVLCGHSLSSLPHRFKEELPLALTRLSGEIAVDGKLDDAAWDKIEPLPLVTQTPVFGEPPSEKSEVMVTYDENYLYLGGKLFDSDPQGIMDNSKKRDAMIGNTDWFGIILDTYNDNQNALAFLTNPNGLRFDANVTHDAFGDLPINISWNAIWEVAVKITHEGWFVEMKIPFTALPCQINADSKVVMGLICWRYIARKNETDIYPAIKNDFGMWSAWKPSLSQKIEFSAIKPRKPFFVSPYGITGIEKTKNLNEKQNSYINNQIFKKDLGLDVRYGLNSNLNLDLSINTDFAQVEVDDEQVNLTRFSLFFPEKRQFFQERSGIFDFDFGTEDKIFYTRRIGIDDGRPVRIYGGARLVGRLEDWDVGILSMQTAENGQTPSLNHSVVRLKKMVINNNSDVGFILTSQSDFQDMNNQTFGFDSRINYSSGNFLNIKWAQTMASGIDNYFGRTQSSRFWISSSSLNTIGFNHGISLSYSGADFLPVLGFQARSDFKRIGGRFGYGWNAPQASRWLQHQILIRGSAFWSNRTGRLESLNPNLEYNYNFKKGAAGVFSLKYAFDDVIEPFNLTEQITIRPGKYSFPSLSWMHFTPPNYSLNLNANLEAGPYYGGRKYTTEFTLSWATSASLELSSTYNFNYLDFSPVLDRLHIGRLKMLYMYSTSLSVSAFLQLNSLEQNWLANIRLRYNPKEGNDLYLVYNEDFNQNRDRSFPRLPWSNQQSILLKYTHTFRL